MRNIALKTLTPDPDRKSISYSVCDIESAAGWINFLVIGLAWKVYAGFENLEQRKYEHFTALSEFCAFVFTEAHPHENIFAHFGGRYDFSFLLKEYYFTEDSYFIHDMIPRGSGILGFGVSTFTRESNITEKTKDKDILGKTSDGHFLIRTRTVNFRDSSAMMPFGLGSLTENFGVDHKKQDIDYEKITKVTPDLLEYLEYDCWGLYECIEKYFHWKMIKEAGAAFTVASQSLKVFRTFLKRDIQSLRPAADAFVRSSYFGGRVEIFKPFYELKGKNPMLRSYDVNSLYPFVMRNNCYPGSFKYETTRYLEHELGFYDVEVDVPDMYIPPLGLRYQGMESRLIFPTGRFRGVWSTLELNYARTLGVKILRVYRGMIFENLGNIFTDYIDYLYGIRKASKKESVDNVLCKLLMNSTYGRFGLNLTREQLVFDRGEVGITAHIEIPAHGNINSIIRLGTKAVELESSFANVAIPAWVTSAARTHMHKLYLQAPDDLFYTDTDCAKTTHKYASNQDDLGEMKLEYKSKLACYILPKTYMEDTLDPMFKVFLENGKISKDKTSMKVVMKGFDRKKISHFKPEDFTSALEGDMRRLRTVNPKKFAPLKSAIKKNEFLALLNESPRQIRTRYNKRRIFKRLYAHTYDTEPLHIKDGLITNLPKDAMTKWSMPEVESLIDAEREALNIIYLNNQKQLEEKEK